jgi:hypothetical protein
MGCIGDVQTLQLDWLLPMHKVGGDHRTASPTAARESSAQTGYLVTMVLVTA